MKIRIISLVFVLFFLIASTVCHASLGIRDPYVKLFLEPGKATRYTLILENRGDSPLPVAVSTIEVFDKKGNPHQRSCAKWIQLDPQFSIPANSVHAMNITINVPKDAKGSYWSDLSYSCSGGKLANDADYNIGIQMMIGQSMYITVVDTVQNDISIESVSAVYAKGKLKISTGIKDTGNVYQETRLYFLITEKSGKIIDILRAGSDRILPNNRFTNIFEKEMRLSRGEYRAIGIIDYDYGNVKRFETSFLVR